MRAAICPFTFSRLVNNTSPPPPPPTHTHLRHMWHGVCAHSFGDAQSAEAHQGFQRYPCEPLQMEGDPSVPLAALGSHLEVPSLK